MTTLTAVAKLPLGYTAHFSWSDDRLDCVWYPAHPRIVEPRAQRKFLAAYQRGRDAFVARVAEAIGGRVAVVDYPAEVRVIEPAERRMAA